MSNEIRRLTRRLVDECLDKVSADVIKGLTQGIGVGPDGSFGREAIRHCLNVIDKCTDSLAVRNGELEGLLRDLEWAGADSDVPRCPACERFPEQGHADNCRLAKALRDE